MTGVDPRLLQALTELAEDSGAAPSPAFRARAREAMHAAVATRAARTSPWASLQGMLGRRAAAALVAAVATASASVLAAGWSAPAGSPLHVVRLAREQVTLVLPGSDRAGRELAFAEDRLREAAGSHDPAASLAEASSLLAAAGRDLPGRSGPEWGRLSRDEKRLRQAQGGDGGGGHGSSGPRGQDGAPGGGTSHASGSGGSGGVPGGASTSGGPGTPGEDGAHGGGTGSGSAGGSRHGAGGPGPSAAATAPAASSTAHGESSDHGGSEDGGGSVHGGSPGHGGDRSSPGSSGEGHR